MPTQSRFNMNRTWLNISFLYLFVIAVLGGLLRLMAFVPTGLNYSNLLHTHSHIAFLGWIYNILFTIIIYSFLKPEKQKKKTYSVIFWLTQIANLGMLFSYPFQGYGAISISFTTMHIFCSYAFAFYFLKDAKSSSDNYSKHKLSFSFIKAAIFFMILSSLGPFALGPIIAKTGSGSELYFNAIYFYLHFQYNGWFTFAVAGLFFRLLENFQISFSRSNAKLFFALMLIACFPAFLLSVLWINPHNSIYLFAGAGALMQLIALFILLITVKNIFRKLKDKIAGWAYFLFGFSLFSFSLKITFQMASAFPAVAEIAFQIRNFIISYLHIVFIGFVSFFIIAFLISVNEFSLSKRYKTGLLLFVSGFIASEVLLYIQGIGIWSNLYVLPAYTRVLFWVSLPMVIGAAFLIRTDFSGYKANKINHINKDE